ncbi:MAG: glucose-1-phosphate adenylyltransferase [Acidobacteria bacterium]|nr:glucose-1-phosphate adenylyltransferase [Acidobacteriota bacterium]
MFDRAHLLRSTLTLILAGGQGERLYPLTKWRPKPSVSFGGVYRIIDFTLSNCLNSGLRRIYVLTQYRSLSMDKHIRLGWNIFNHDNNEFIFTVPPQQHFVGSWYRGTADAVFQNIDLLEEEHPHYVVILSGDHVYKMNYSLMLEAHQQNDASVTLGTVRVPVAESRRFGVVQLANDWRVSGFVEKPEKPEELTDFGELFVNMGVYIFNTAELVRAVIDDAKQDTEHDFGKNLLPTLVASGAKVYAYPFLDENRKESQYWRDIGTLDSYYEASMDLVTVNPAFNLYDPEWPVRTLQPQLPPAKTVFELPLEKRVGAGYDSIISSGCIVSGGVLRRSILSPHVRVRSYGEIVDSILMENVEVERHCRLQKVIVDEAVRIPEGTQVGYDPEEDRRRFTVSEQGVVVIPSGTYFD